MSNDRPKLTLERWVALDQAVSEYIPDWQRAIFACSDSELDFGEVGVLFPSAPNEAGVEAVTTFLAASRQAPTRLLAALRGLQADWAVYRQQLDAVGNHGQAIVLDGCQQELGHLIETLDLAAQ